METFVQGLIMSFREGLEAFLIIVVLLKFLEKIDKKLLKKNVWLGLAVGIAVSLVCGAILMGISSYLGGVGATAKLWESGASFIATILIATFIIWMINHGAKIKSHIEEKAALSLSKKGIFLIALFMVSREGVEIVLFQFAGKYPLSSILLGVAISICFVTVIYYSLVKIKIQTIFAVTLAYLILQAGFLFGYSIHEGLSAAKELGMIAASHPIFTTAFDLSDTVFNHKEGVVGIPLYVGIGWYSKPEWIQFISQYGLTFLLLCHWYTRSYLRKEDQG